MKLNKKGFMLAEVVIVASVITTVLVFLYISINRMSNAYDTRNRYYDIDAMQVAIGINDSIKKDTSYENIEFYEEINEENKFIKFYMDNNISTSIKAFYATSDLQSIREISDSIGNSNVYLKDYLDYLEDNIEFDKYKYLIIVELEKKDADDVYFYTLKVGDISETQS